MTSAAMPVCFGDRPVPAARFAGCSATASGTGSGSERGHGVGHPSMIPCHPYGDTANLRVRFPDIAFQV